MHGIHDTDCMSRRGVIDPDLLRNFLRVAETGSFPRAAEQAGRTQSTISMQVSRLEAVLGRKVFSRSKGTTVRLTGDGSRLFTHAKEMLAVHDAIWDDFHMLDGPGREAAEGAAPDDYALPLRAQREAFTAQVMLTLLTNEKFTEAYAMVMRSVETQQSVDPACMSARDDDLYMALLSMLEYISINFLSNTMDREIILRQRKSGLLRVYQVLNRYIDHKRQVWGRPNAYRSFELVVRDHIVQEGSVMQQGTAE